MMPLPSEWIDRIFMRLHGRFGNNFIDKFKTGQLDDFGNDIGLMNAKLVWSEELAGMSGDKIKNALLHSYDYAPSCDQFKAQCKLQVTLPEHQDYKALPKPKISDEKINEIHDKLSAFTTQKRDYHAWAHRILKNSKNYPELSIRYAKEVIGEIYDAD